MGTSVVLQEKMFAQSTEGKGRRGGRALWFSHRSGIRVSDLLACLWAATRAGFGNRRRAGLRMARAPTLAA